MTPQVLVVSRDAMLLQTRQLILGAFFRVQTAGRIREAEALLVTRTFDLIILCYTLTEAECQEVIRLADELKHRPRILMLTTAGFSPTELGPDDATIIDTGSYCLLKRSAEMLGV